MLAFDVILDLGEHLVWASIVGRELRRFRLRDFVDHEIAGLELSLIRGICRSALDNKKATVLQGSKLNGFKILIEGEELGRGFGRIETLLGKLEITTSTSTKHAIVGTETILRIIRIIKVESNGLENMRSAPVLLDRGVSVIMVSKKRMIRLLVLSTPLL
jgi:hypothetical protein